MDYQARILGKKKRLFLLISLEKCTLNIPKLQKRITFQIKE